VTPPLDLSRLYRLFRRPLALVPPARTAILAMVIATVVLVGIAVVQVARRNECKRLGYELASVSERVREAEETSRLLELERATLTRPERIRALATALGMVPAPPDKIRVIRAEAAPAPPAPPEAGP
jgi:cell division protein FtsL